MTEVCTISPELYVQRSKLGVIVGTTCSATLVFSALAGIKVCMLQNNILLTDLMVISLRYLQQEGKGTIHSEACKPNPYSDWEEFTEVERIVSSYVTVLRQLGSYHCSNGRLSRPSRTVAVSRWTCLFRLQVHFGYQEVFIIST